jgi:hypothetical protein
MGHVNSYISSFQGLNNPRIIQTNQLIFYQIETNKLGDGNIMKIILTILLILGNLNSVAYSQDSSCRTLLVKSLAQHEHYVQTYDNPGVVSLGIMNGLTLGLAFGVVPGLV